MALTCKLKSGFSGQVYGGPSTSTTAFETVGSISTSDTCDVFWAESGFLFIQYMVSSNSKMKRGYIHQDNVTVIGGTALPKMLSSSVMYTKTHLICDVLYGPGTGSTYESRGSVDGTDNLALLATDGNYKFIEYTISGTTKKKRGYIHQDKTAVVPSIPRDYAGISMLTIAQKNLLDLNKSTYQDAAVSSSVPWQIIAAIHFRETKFSRYVDNVNGPYCVSANSSYAVGTTLTDAQFLTATKEAALVVKSNAGNNILTTDDNVKKFAFFKYNGAAAAYVNQATSLGFNSTQANNGEGSPYVMNRFDAQRDPTVEPVKTNKTWGQIKTNGGSISYPANADVGAFTLYKKL